MDGNKKVLVDVEIHAVEALKQLAATKIRIDELREAQKILDKSTEQGRLEYEAYGVEIKRLSGVAQGYQKEISNTMKLQKIEQDSLDALKTKLSLNTAAYDKLSEAERNSAKGAGLQKAISETTQKLKEEEEALGNNRRSVGDYAKAGMSLRTEIKQLTESLTQMKIAGQESSAEYKEMSLRAAQLNDAMGDVKQQTRGMASDTQGLDIATQSLGGLVGAFGAYQSVVGATIDENGELANVMKNVQVAMAALVSLTAIQNTIQKQSVVYIAAENLLKKIGIDQTAKAAAAEAALNTVKSSGNVVTKASAAATWLWNKALAANPVILVTIAIAALIAAGYGLFKMFDSLTTSTDKAALSTTDLQLEIDRTAKTLKRMADDTDFDIAIAEASGASVQELINLRREAAKTALAVADANTSMVMSSKNATTEQKDAAMNASKEAWNAVMKINNEATVYDIKSRKDASEQQQKDSKNNYLKQIDERLKFDIAQLKSQKKYRNDSTKTDAENNALRFQHEYAFEQQMFALKQTSEQKKLKFQREQDIITETEYDKQYALLQLAQTEFDNTQADKTAEFFEGRRKEIIGMMEKDAAAQIQDIKANYAQAMKDVSDDPALSKDEKVFYRSGLERQQGKEIAAIREQQAQQINSMLELKYKEDLATYSDNEREKLLIEMKITEQAITQKKELGLSTAEDEAKLRAQQLQMNQIQLNAELLHTQGHLDAQYQIKKAALDRELEINKDNADKINEIKAQEVELDREYTEAKIANIEMWAAKGMELMGALNEFANALGQAEVQQAEENNAKQKASLDARLKSGKISQQQYDKDVARLDADLDKKKAEIARKQAIREKMMSVFQIGLNTAMAIMKNTATLGLLPAMPVNILTGILGAVQLATALATPLPKARKGGRIVGSSHENGGVLIEGEGGEQIVNKYSAAAFPELLNLINAMGNTSGRMPDGGYAARAMMRDSTSIYGTRKIAENTSVMRNQGNAANNSINNDAILAKLDELGARMENIKIYATVEDIRKADKRYTDVEQIAIR